VSKTRTSDVPLTGIAIGAVLLAVLVLFAVFLPRAIGDSGTGGGAVALPDSLPGGYVAADRTDAWKNASANVKGHEAEIVAQVKAELNYGDSALTKTSKNAFANRIYLQGGGKAIYFVQAFRSAGGAFSPGEISDPMKLQQGSTVQQLIKIGDAVCIVDGTVGNPGQIQPSQTQCQRSQGDLTVQVTAPQVAASDVAKVTDLVFSKVG
jgi:hypothetical protein